MKASHPALARACGEAASPQVSNVATIGGNLLQRPRCWYYRLESYKCIKKGGDTCFAVAGENRYHVLFGGGPAFAAHPSNSAVPLVAYGASFVLDGPKGGRVVPAGDFFLLPAQDPTRENALQPGELLKEIRVPSAAGWKSAYYEVRERAGVRLAARLRRDRAQERGRDREGGPRRARAGGDDPVALESAEKALVGKPVNAASAEAAGKAAVEGAQPMTDNGYKVDLRGDAGAPHRRLSRVRTAMSENHAPAAPDAAEKAETPVCRRLRTKMYYVLGREHVNLRVSSPTAQYWCSLTATVMGPDDAAVQPGGLPARPRLLRAGGVADGRTDYAAKTIACRHKFIVNNYLTGKLCDVHFAHGCQDCVPESRGVRIASGPPGATRASPSVRSSCAHDGPRTP